MNCVACAVFRAEYEECNSAVAVFIFSTANKYVLAAAAVKRCVADTSRQGFICRRAFQRCVVFARLQLVNTVEASLFAVELATPILSEVNINRAFIVREVNSRFIALEVVRANVRADCSFATFRRDSRFNELIATLEHLRYIFAVFSLISYLNYAAKFIALDVDNAVNAIFSVISNFRFGEVYLDCIALFFVEVVICCEVSIYAANRCATRCKNDRCAVAFFDVIEGNLVTAAVSIEDVATAAE